MEAFEVLGRLKGSITQLIEIQDETFQHLFNAKADYYPFKHSERAQNLYQDFLNCCTHAQENIKSADNLGFQIASNISNFSIDIDTKNSNLRALKNYIQE